MSLEVAAVQKRDTSGIADIGAPTAAISFEAFLSCGLTLPQVYAQSVVQRSEPSGNAKGRGMGDKGCGSRETFWTSS